MAKPSPCHTVLSTFLAQDSAAQLKRRLPASPPISVRSSTPAFCDVRSPVARKLSGVARPVGDVDGRGEGDGGPGDGCDLLDLGGGTVQPGEPGAGAAGRRRESVGREVVDVGNGWIVLAPDHPQVRGGPDLPAPLWIGLPVGAGGLVQQDDLARREPGRVRHRHRVRALDGIGGQSRWRRPHRRSHRWSRTAPGQRRSAARVWR